MSASSVTALSPSRREEPACGERAGLVPPSGRRTGTGGSPAEQPSLAVLWERYLGSRDREARAELTAAYLPLVRYVVSRLRPQIPAHADRDSLAHSGVLGLVGAIDRFDPDRGVQFPTFAVPRIKGAVLDAARSSDWAPRSVRSRSRALAVASRTLEERLQRAPTAEELAGEMGIARREVEAIRDQEARGRVGRLDHEALDLVPDHSPDPAVAFEVAEELAVLRRGVAALPERERRVLELYYFDDCTLKQIGEVLGVSEGRVSRIHARAIRMMLDRMRAGEHVA